MQVFLRHVNASHTIYFERFGDNLFQGIAYQIFAEREQVWQFHDFAYEHITRKPVAVSENASEMCMGFGAFALGTVSGTDAVNATSRLLEVLDEKSYQGSLAERNRMFYMRCFRINPCIIGVYPGSDPGIYLGSATSEQPTCGRQPAPYYCGIRLEPAADYGSALNQRTTMIRQRTCRGTLKPDLVLALRMALQQQPNASRLESPVWV